MDKQPAAPVKRAIPAMHSVKSGSIQAMGHSGDVLSIKFGNDKIYQYKGVSSEAFRAMSEAESVGIHFMKQIRNNFKGVIFDADAVE